MAYRKYSGKYKITNPRNKGKYSYRTTYGKKFRTRKGRYGHYVYKNGRRVGFKSARRRRY